MTPPLIPIDREALREMPLEALREQAHELGITGDLEAMDRATLEEALVERVAGLEPTSSTAWQRRLHRPPEPEVGIYIDRGQPVPDFYPGSLLRVMARDPNVLFVYWESDEAPDGGWHLAAYDHAGGLVATFTTPPGRHRSGYLAVDDIARVANVVLSRLVDGLPRPLWSLSVRFGARRLRTGERWVDIRSGAAHDEAPAEGQLPYAAAGTAGLSSMDALRVGQPGAPALPSSSTLWRRSPASD